MRALLRELQASMNPKTPEKQEGVWGGLKKAARSAVDAVDTATSFVPVVGAVKDAGIATYKANKAAGHVGKALGKWVTGDKKGAATQAKKAAGAGVDALGRTAGVAAGAVAPGVGGGAVKVATRALVKPVISGVVKAGTTAAHKALNKKPAVPAVKPTVPLVKRKPVLGAPSASESVLFQSVRALVEFRSLVGLPITQEHQQQLEAEEALDAETLDAES